MRQFTPAGEQSSVCATRRGKPVNGPREEAESETQALDQRKGLATRKRKQRIGRLGREGRIAMRCHDQPARGSGNRRKRRQLGLPARLLRGALNDGTTAKAVLRAILRIVIGRRVVRAGAGSIGRFGAGAGAAAIGNWHRAPCLPQANERASQHDHKQRYGNCFSDHRRATNAEPVPLLVPRTCLETDLVPPPRHGRGVEGEDPENMTKNVSQNLRLPIPGKGRG